MTELVRANNPGPMTLDGTNTWLLGSSRIAIVDPGPDDPTHRAAIRTAVGERPVDMILLTHDHPDHSAGARSLAEALGVPVRALDPAHRLGSEGLAGGDVIEVDGVDVRVLATPGHSADHVCFVVGDTVLTGDHVLGRGTTVVAYPDGRMGDYLDSLRRLADVGATTLLPGHGPVVENPAEVVAYYLEHRAERERQVLAALAAGARTPREVVERVYADVDRNLWGAAELSVRAHLDLLAETGRLPG